LIVGGGTGRFEGLDRVQPGGRVVVIEQRRPQKALNLRIVRFAADNHVVRGVVPDFDGAAASAGVVAGWCSTRS
ncbi:MAG: hypothetical protein GVY25_15905, partial [Bacteroidetes bacterium]|nr:hypothetical protein [Bacteroidota bacterium]